MALQSDASATYRPDGKKVGISKLQSRSIRTRAYSPSETKHEIHRIIVVQLSLIVDVSLRNKILCVWEPSLVTRHGPRKGALATPITLVRSYETYHAFATTDAPIHRIYEPGYRSTLEKGKLALWDIIAIVNITLRCGVPTWTTKLSK